MTRRREKQKTRHSDQERERRLLLLLERGWIRDANQVPENSIPVDPDRINLGGSYCRPVCFRDLPFTCQDCGAECVWNAESQRWYFETFLAPYYEQPIRCGLCRRKERERKMQARLRAGHEPNAGDAHRS